MCMVTGKMLPPVFLLKWRKDDGRWQEEGERTERKTWVTMGIHRLVAASNKTANTLPALGSILIIVVDV